MKRKIAVVLCFVIFMTLLCGYYKYQNKIKDMLLPGITAGDEIAGVIACADDNPGINYDIKGYLKDGAFILFLPVRCDLSAVQFYAVDENGRRLEKIQHDFNAEKTMLVGGVAVTAMKSQVPSLEIVFNKGSLSELEASADHSVYAFGNMTISASDTEVLAKGYEAVLHSKNGKNGSAGTMSMRGHGNITWGLDKKSYNIFAENEMSLLGMKPADNWVLLANAEDYSLLRNEVFLDLAGEVSGTFTPECRPVDLFVEGEYRGLYLLTQRVEISKASVDIVKGRDVLYRWGMLGEDKYKLDTDLFRDEETKVVEVIDSAGVPEDYARAQQFMEELSQPGDEYLEMTDITSFARYYWLQEFAKNTDATSRSFYTVWKNDSQKMYAEPVWDMDRTAGVVEPFMRPADYLYPTEWAVRKEEWFTALFEKESFREEVKRVYLEENLDRIFAEAVQGIPAKRDYIRPSADMNFIRWEVLSKEQNNQIVRYMGVSTFDTQTEWLYEWLSQRREWLRENLDL